MSEASNTVARLIASSSDAGTPQISVVVSTYQRSAQLPRLFAALEAQTLDRFEVVVVDNGTLDDTEAVLTKLVSETTMNVKAIRVEPNRGPAAGRNAGWRYASGEFVAFTDDDCLPRPEWLERGLAALRNTDAVVAGMTIPEYLPTVAGPFSRSGFPENAQWLATCNVFYRRKDIEAVGGFDELFETPAAEDTDLGWRIQSHAGRDFFYATDAVVEHAVWPSNFRASFREATRWYGIPLLVARHPAAGRAILHRRFFWKASHPRVLLATAGLAAAAFIPLAPRVLAPLALAACAPWLWFRLITRPLPARRVKYRPLYIPGAFLIDLAEVWSMVRGSIRYRTLVL